MATSAAAAKAPAAVKAPAAAKAPPAEAAPPEAPPKKKKGKFLVILIVAVLLLALGGAGAWYYLSVNAEDEADEPKASSKPPVFLPVDQFTVNLQPEDGQQFLQVAMTLKVVDQAAVEIIKAQLPEVRSRVLLLLSSKKPSQLISVEGKTTLAEEIVREVEAPLPVEKAKAPQGAKAKSGGKDEGGDAKAKKAKGKAKAKGKDEKADDPGQRRVLAVFFTHFIVQ